MIRTITTYGLIDSDNEATAFDSQVSIKNVLTYPTNLLRSFYNGNEQSFNEIVEVMDLDDKRISFQNKNEFKNSISKYIKDFEQKFKNYFKGTAYKELDKYKENFDLDFVSKSRTLNLKSSDKFVQTTYEFESFNDTEFREIIDTFIKTPTSPAFITLADIDYDDKKINILATRHHLEKNTRSSRYENNETPILTSVGKKNKDNKLISLSSINFIKERGLADVSFSSIRSAKELLGVAQSITNETILIKTNNDVPYKVYDEGGSNIFAKSELDFNGELTNEEREAFDQFFSEIDTNKKVSNDISKINNEGIKGSNPRNETKEILENSPITKKEKEEGNLKELINDSKITENEEFEKVAPEQIIEPAENIKDEKVAPEQKIDDSFNSKMENEKSIFNNNIFSMMQQELEDAEKNLENALSMFNDSINKGNSLDFSVKRVLEKYQKNSFLIDAFQKAVTFEYIKTNEKTLEINRLNELVEKYRSEIHNKNDEIGKLEEDNLLQKKEFKKLEKDYTQKLLEVKDLIEEKDNEINNLKIEVEENVQSLSDMNKKNELLFQKNQKLEIKNKEDVRNLKDSHEKEINKINNKHNESVQKINTEFEKKTNSLEKLNNEYKETSNLVKEQNKIMSETNKELKNNNDDLLKRLEDVKSETIKLREETFKINESNKQYHKINEQLKRQLQEIKNNNVALEKQLKEKAKELKLSNDIISAKQNSQNYSETLNFNKKYDFEKYSNIKRKSENNTDYSNITNLINEVQTARNNFKKENNIDAFRIEQSKFYNLMILRNNGLSMKALNSYLETAKIPNKDQYLINIINHADNLISTGLLIKRDNDYIFVDEKAKSILFENYEKDFNTLSDINYSEYTKKENTNNSSKISVEDFDIDDLIIEKLTQTEKEEDQIKKEEDKIKIMSEIGGIEFDKEDPFEFLENIEEEKEESLNIIKNK